jgi:hypothetical protein
MGPEAMLNNRIQAAMNTSREGLLVALALK